MKRVYNFSAGPAVLPEEVLREAADEMLDYKGCGRIYQTSGEEQPLHRLLESICG